MCTFHKLYTWTVCLCVFCVYVQFFRDQIQWQAGSGSVSDSVSVLLELERNSNIVHTSASDLDAWNIFFKQNYTTRWYWMKIHCFVYTTKRRKNNTQNIIHRMKILCAKLNGNESTSPDQIFLFEQNQMKSNTIRNTINRN